MSVQCIVVIVFNNMVICRLDNGLCSKRRDKSTICITLLVIYILCYSALKNALMKRRRKHLNTWSTFHILSVVGWVLHIAISTFFGDGHGGPFHWLRRGCPFWLRCCHCWCCHWSCRWVCHFWDCCCPSSCFCGLCGFRCHDSLNKEQLLHFSWQISQGIVRFSGPSALSA